MTNGTTNLFDQVTSTDQVQKETQTYIGEGKKYANVEEADKAFGHLNKHVTTLEEENAALRAQAEKASTIDEVLTAMKQKHIEVQESTEPTISRNHQELDVNAIVEQAVNKMSVMEHEKKELANAQEVVTKLTSKYGEKAGDIYTAKAQELGVDLDSLASQSPKAVLAYFEDSVAPTKKAEVGTINTASLNDSQAQYGTYEYWNKLEKEGKISKDKKLQMQHKSLQELGPEEFGLYK
jgi:hypothetical protein